MGDEQNQVPGFNGDLTDGRRRGEWQSRYPPEARRVMWVEFGVLIFFLLCGIAALFLTWMDYPQKWLRLDPFYTKRFASFALSIFGGLVGGVCFSLKWLVHVVAHQRWHADRIFWRMGAPLKSSAVGLATYFLSPWGLFNESIKIALNRPEAAVSFAFLAGLFSDLTLGKLAQLYSRLWNSFRSSGRNTQADSDRTAYGPPA